MSEKENKESLGSESIATIKKFHPFAFILMFALMFFANYTLNSGLNLEKKVVIYALALGLFFVALISEFWSISSKFIVY